MIDSNTLSEILTGITEGSVVPYLGAGVLKGVTNIDDGTPIPADSDSLILAMNNGQPMAPRLMYEFPRAAMNMELKKGRSFVERFLNETYGEKKWTRSATHDWLASIKPPYVIDINRDTQLQDSYNTTAHNLIVGAARIGGTDYRFKLFYYNGSNYTEIDPADADASLPSLFKPMGSPTPKPSYIAADADYVDYITELMGGFAIPAYIKDYRVGKRYLFLGMSLNRDTERMVLSDMIYAADKPAGWALIPTPTDKERRFCRNQNLEVIEADCEQLIAAAEGLLKENVA